MTALQYNIRRFQKAGRDAYPLRPELVESMMYVYRATGDRKILKLAAIVVDVSCSRINDSKDGRQEMMETLQMTLFKKFKKLKVSDIVIDLGLGEGFTETKTRRFQTICFTCVI